MYFLLWWTLLSVGNEVRRTQIAMRIRPLQVEWMNLTHAGNVTYGVENDPELDLSAYISGD